MATGSETARATTSRTFLCGLSAANAARQSAMNWSGSNIVTSFLLTPRGSRHFMAPTLLGRAVVARGLLELLDVRRCQLRSIDLQRELVELAGETERHLVIIGHRRAGVGADVEVLVPLQDQRNSALHSVARHLLAVDFEHTSAAAADAAQIVKCERADSQPVVFEVELQRVLAWHQCIRSLPAHAFQVDEVPQKLRLALEHIEPVTAEAAALGHDHAFGAARRDVDLSLEGVRRVE